MWLIVGLGNPGAQYALTRHNIGFQALDLLYKSCGNPPTKNDFNAIISKFKWESQDVVTAQPQTFMNRSGDSVIPLMQFYKIPQDHLIVIHDEIDLPFGSMRIHKNRSPGGNNGIKDITTKLGTQDYIRIRLGIGRPPHPEMSVADYVLQKFSKEEMAVLPEFLERAIDATEVLITKGLQIASTQFHSDKTNEK